MPGESQVALEICSTLSSSISLDRSAIKSVYRLKIRAGLFDVVVAVVAFLPACSLPQTPPMYVAWHGNSGPSLRRVGGCSQGSKSHSNTQRGNCNFQLEPEKATHNRNSNNSSSSNLKLAFKARPARYADSTDCRLRGSVNQMRLKIFDA